MELKRRFIGNQSHAQGLLIVPYGIETKVNHANLLVTCLLIVPYGIETNIIFCGVHFSSLLIVPYGIETYYTHYNSHEIVAFNRTLWN